jgi:tRNA(fMet)-specific endonuclease VapC
VRKYILDSNAVGDLVNRRGNVPRRAAAARRTGALIGSCYPIVGEMYYGVELSDTRDVNLPRLSTGLAKLKFWPYDRAAAETFGRIRAEMRRAGHIIQVIDLQLAAIALTLTDCVAVSSDTDLLLVPGLTVENWAA